MPVFFYRKKIQPHYQILPLIYCSLICAYLSILTASGCTFDSAFRSYEKKKTKLAIDCLAKIKVNSSYHLKAQIFLLDVYHKAKNHKKHIETTKIIFKLYSKFNDYRYKLIDELEKELKYWGKQNFGDLKQRNFAEKNIKFYTNNILKLVNKDNKYKYKLTLADALMFNQKRKEAFDQYLQIFLSSIKFNNLSFFEMSSIQLKKILKKKTNIAHEKKDSFYHHYSINTLGSDQNEYINIYLSHIFKKKETSLFIKFYQDIINENILSIHRLKKIIDDGIRNLARNNNRQLFYIVKPFYKTKGEIGEYIYKNYGDSIIKYKINEIKSSLTLNNYNKVDRFIEILKWPLIPKESKERLYKEIIGYIVKFRLDLNLFKWTQFYISSVNSTKLKNKSKFILNILNALFERRKIDEVNQLSTTILQKTCKDKYVKKDFLELSLFTSLSLDKYKDLYENIEFFHLCNFNKEPFKKSLSLVNDELKRKERVIELEKIIKYLGHKWNKRNFLIPSLHFLVEYYTKKSRPRLVTEYKYIVDDILLNEKNKGRKVEKKYLKYVNLLKLNEVKTSLVLLVDRLKEDQLSYHDFLTIFDDFKAKKNLLFEISYADEKNSEVLSLRLLKKYNKIFYKKLNSLEKKNNFEYYEKKEFRNHVLALRKDVKNDNKLISKLNRSIKNEIVTYETGIREYRKSDLLKMIVSKFDYKTFL